jgi:DNA helicase HerA-like ATPase
VEKLLIAKAGDMELGIIPSMANRHGLIAGATGTGKTVSLKVLAESFSTIGVPVFLADIKGDLSGTCEPGATSPKMEERFKLLNIPGIDFKGYPVRFWDVFGEQGHPVRTTISEMGPLLLSRLLNLNEIQGGVMNIVFKIADDNGMLLLDLKDLRSMLEFVGNNADQFTTAYGNVSKQTIGTIQRGFLTLEEQGADKFFGEPALSIFDFIRTDTDGRGFINILSADKLFPSPALYSTFLLWMMAELFEQLPEVGDLEKPKIVFFFDEAHLLFNEAPKALLDKVEQVVRLIRSKGVGIYFITQNPLDIPDMVLGQLGNRVQHALRAFTPRDQKAVNAAADTFRVNPKINVQTVITELAVGEALVSFLEASGSPSVVERAYVMPPRSLIGPCAPGSRQSAIQRSEFFGRYETVVDRESAYEVIQKKLVAKTEELNRQQADPNVQQQREYDYGGNPRPTSTRREPASTGQKMFESLGRAAASTVGRQIANTLIRGVLGSLLRR